MKKQDLSLLVVLFLFSALLGSCSAEEGAPSPAGRWPMLGNNAQHTGYSPKTSALTGKVRWRYLTWDEIWGTPVVADGIVYAASFDHYLYALNGATGRKEWRFHADGWLSGTPAVAEEMVYVGGEGGLYAVNTARGRQEWKFPLPEQAWAAHPTVAQDTVYFAAGIFTQTDTGAYGSGYFILYALDASDGSERWSRQLSHGLPLAGAGPCPAVGGGLVLIGDGSNTLYALDSRNGTEVWRFQGKGYGEMFSIPVIAEGTAYVSSSDGCLYSLELHRGQLRWEFCKPGLGPSSPAVAGRVVYLVDHDGWLYALQAADGTVRWQVELDSPVPSVELAPSIGGNVVYVATISSLGDIYAFRATDGHLLWKITGQPGMDGSFGSPAIAEGVLYVASGQFIFAIE